jgi:hypothetical protein
MKSQFYRVAVCVTVFASFYERKEKENMLPTLAQLLLLLQFLHIPVSSVPVLPGESLVQAILAFLQSLGL